MQGLLQAAHIFLTIFGARAVAEGARLACLISLWGKRSADLSPDATRPTLRDVLGASEEANAILAALIEIPERRILPSAEAVIARPHRDRDVDANRADFHLAGEALRCAPPSREDRTPIALTVVQAIADGLLEGPGAKDLQHGPKISS